MKCFLGIALAFTLALSISGCAMKWNSSWQDTGAGNPTPRSAILFEKAQSSFNQADDEESLWEAIKAFEMVLAENPGDYRALTQLSTQYILLGTAYTESRRQKSRYFLKAMSYAERAMYTNSRFQALVDGGARPWEAAEVLTDKEVEAMFFWVTALQYEFKEGMTLVGKIVNIEWLQRALIFLDRIEAVAPEFGGGAVEFAKVICYFVLPASKGGSKSKGETYMRQSVLKGENWLLPRWARAKYYYPIRGEGDKSRRELEWVASRDPSQFADPYPWRVYFQENSRQLLR